MSISASLIERARKLSLIRLSYVAYRRKTRSLVRVNFISRFSSVALYMVLVALVVVCFRLLGISGDVDAPTLRFFVLVGFGMTLGQGVTRALTMNVPMVHDNLGTLGGLSCSGPVSIYRAIARYHLWVWLVALAPLPLLGPLVVAVAYPIVSTHLVLLEMGRLFDSALVVLSAILVAELAGDLVLLWSTVGGAKTIWRNVATFAGPLVLTALWLKGGELPLPDIGSIGDFVAQMLFGVGAPVFGRTALALALVSGLFVTLFNLDRVVVRRVLRYG